MENNKNDIEEDYILYGYCTCKDDCDHTWMESCEVCPYWEIDN